MEETQIDQKIPDCIRQLGFVRRFFLDEKKPINEQPENFQKILGAIRDIVLVFYPFNRTDNTVLEVPSHRLAELGFVSEKTKMVIERRKLRTQKKNGYAADTDKNIIVIIRTDLGFMLTETYVTEEEFFGSGIRRDCVVRDQVYLEITPQELSIRIERETAEYHVHTLNEVWYSQGMKSVKLYDPIEVTARHINIIFALLLEGIVPGYLKSCL